MRPTPPNWTEDERCAGEEAACDYFEQVRDGMEPDANDFLDRLTSDAARQSFCQSAVVMLGLIGMSHLAPAPTHEQTLR